MSLRWHRNVTLGRNSVDKRWRHGGFSSGEPLFELLEPRPNVAQVKAEKRDSRLVVVRELLPLACDTAAKNTAVSLEEPKGLSRGLRGCCQPACEAIKIRPQVLEAVLCGDEKCFSESRHPR